MKKDIEDSPLNVVRNELNSKHLDLVEMERKFVKEREENDERRVRIVALEEEIIKCKKRSKTI